MNHSFMAFALQQVGPDNSSMWIILIVVLLILFFIVLIVGVGLTIFFVMRKRSKAQKVPATSAAAVLDNAGASLGIPPPVIPEAPVYQPAPAEDLSASEQETLWPATKDSSSAAASASEPTEFDPSRTVAISRDRTVEISYGSIKFVSGVLAGEEFAVDAEGAYIGREPTLSQIVVSDPRISKRHLWVGVRDGVVTIVDQESRNGTFINDPRSERVHEARLNSGDTVIMGESDVARFEYHS